jgi:hypothetical protein
MEVDKRATIVVVAGRLSSHHVDNDPVQKQRSLWKYGYKPHKSKVHTSQCNAENERRSFALPIAN